MAGLFGNLPPPSAPKVEDKVDKNNGERESKRAKKEEEQPETIDVASPPPAAVEEQPPPSPQPTVLAALQRIESHISNPKKFCKASELLRQLLSPSSGALDHTSRTHGNAVFTALVASMEDDPTRSNDPLFSREYSKLFTVASKHSQLFTPSQRAQLDVYGIWAVTLNQLLATDDSFTFSKTINLIKEMISELPVLEFPEQVEEEEKALVSPYTEGKNSAEKILEDVRVWSDVAVVAYRRAALASCIHSSKESYSKLWARTSIDLLIEHASKHSSQHFLPEQRNVINDMVAFVREQRVARKTKGGGSSDATAFEKARGEWGKATLSARGGVGSGGDHKSEAWLG